MKNSFFFPNFGPYFHPIRGQKGPENMAILDTHLKVPLIYSTCKSSFMVSHQKLFDKMAQNLQKSQFIPIFDKQISNKKLDQYEQK